MAERKLVKRGNILPLGEYRSAEGKTEYDYAVPNMLMPLVDGYNALAYSSGGAQDPEAPQGYVSQNALLRGAEGIAGAATLGSVGAVAPANALRTGAARLGRGMPERPSGQSRYIDDMAQDAAPSPPWADRSPQREDPRALYSRYRAAGDEAYNGGDFETARNMYEMAIDQARVGQMPDRMTQMITQRLEDARMELDPFYLGKAPEKDPPDLWRPSVSGDNRELPSGNSVSKSTLGLEVYRDNVGGIEGSLGRDPQIHLSSIDPQYRGQGVGSSMYRDWAKEAGNVPFRSDSQVSVHAAKMYEKMFPKYGYNVMRNPDAVIEKGAGLGGADAWVLPGGYSDYPSHIFRVEPPGKKSTEFYSSGAGALPLSWTAPDEEK